jgi:murein L,D-transpeptidase YafK
MLLLVDVRVDATRSAPASAINTGFPNTFDKANDRMIHGDCASRGCYAMTDDQIGEIYSLARDSLLGSQQSFQIQAYPFRMTPLSSETKCNTPADLISAG